MAGTARRLRLRLFLEGVEVPVIAATVQGNPNSPLAASIQVPPLAAGTRLLPRTLVHLFFLDFYEGQSSHVSIQGAGSTPEDTSRFDALGLVGGEKLTRLARQQEDKQRAAELGSIGSVGDAIPGIDSRYKLLFGGEIVGFNWTKNTSRRSLILQCLDWSNYWDYAYQWNNTDIFGPGLKAQFSGGATNLFTDFLEDEGRAIIKTLQTPSATFPNLKGLLGGIVHLLETIGGSYYTPKSFAGQNTFFSVAELRLRITQMITAFESDPTASRLMNADAYDGLFGRTLGGLGAQVSIRQAINALMAMIFHETYAIPTPLFVPGTGNGPSGRNQRLARNDPNFSFIATTADELQGTVEDIRAGFQQGSTTLFKSLASVQSIDTLGQLGRRLSAARTTCMSLTNRLTDKEVQAARGIYTTCVNLLNKAITLTKQWRPGIPDKVDQALQRVFTDLAAQLTKAQNFYIVSATGGVTAARLNQQIFRPDVWFSAPPRCNVLFPESYHQLSYSRSFLQEPTRLLLKTNDEFFGEDELFDAFYYAPTAVTLKPKKQGQSDLQAILGNNLLDHELFTGVLPVFEKMGELNIFGARSGTVNGKKAKIGMAQRTTNFLYFKYRFAARQMSVSGKFNPYVVPGFPGLIIDKYTPQDQLEERQRLIDARSARVVVGPITGNGASGTAPGTEVNLGTHFLANFTELTHSVDQGNGQTDINCSYARQPEEAIEFLGAISKDQTVRQRDLQDASRVTVVAAVNPPREKTQGPNQGNITRVEDVTDAYRAQDLETGARLPLFNGPKQKGSQRVRVVVPVGLTATATQYGKDVAAVFGTAATILSFRAFRLTEEVPRYRQQLVDLPAEEYIRPGWYGDCWHPALIGKVYEQFFRTGAITDQQQVTTGEGGSIGTTREVAEAALQQADTALQQGDFLSAGPGLLALDQSSSVQSAVSFLVQTYSTIRQGGFDVEEFIRSYTWRPVASMNDMFGSEDLEFSPDGTQVAHGVEGFHSRAFGPYSDLFALVTPEIESITGIQRGSAVAQRADVRNRKQEAVKDYVSALTFSRAVVG